MNHYFETIAARRLHELSFSSARTSTSSLSTVSGSAVPLRRKRHELLL